MQPVIRHIHLLAILLAISIALFPCPALAVQWQALAGTSRYQVALDSESVRLTPLGRLAVWLRFIPLGEAQRKAGALEYGEKGYRSHLEYYEIDCSEQSAVLGLIDIFDTARARLKRLKGGDRPDAIIPGSVLDLAAQRICSELDEDALEIDPEELLPDDGGANDSEEGEKAATEMSQKIESLIKRTASEPSNHEAWSLLGNAYFDDNLPAEAIAAYDKALALRPDDTNILNDQGAMFRQQGNFLKALENFEKAFKIDPHNLESLYNSGYVYAFDLNDILTALKIWKRYIELDSGSETARQVQSFIESYKKGNN